MFLQFLHLHFEEQAMAAWKDKRRVRATKKGRVRVTERKGYELLKRRRRATKREGYEFTNKEVTSYEKRGHELQKGKGTSYKKGRHELSKPRVQLLKRMVRVTKKESASVVEPGSTRSTFSCTPICGSGTLWNALPFCLHVNINTGEKHVNGGSYQK